MTGEGLGFFHRPTLAQDVSDVGCTTGMEVGPAFFRVLGDPGRFKIAVECPSSLRRDVEQRLIW